MTEASTVSFHLHYKPDLERQTAETLSKSEAEAAFVMTTVSGDDIKIFSGVYHVFPPTAQIMAALFMLPAGSVMSFYPRKVRASVQRA